MKKLGKKYRYQQTKPAAVRSKKIVEMAAFGDLDDVCGKFESFS